MHDVFSFVAIAAFILLAIIVVWVGHVQARRRREQLSAWAECRGCTFTASPEREPPCEDGFELFNRGRRHGASNASSGLINGAEMVCFDWTFVTGGGKHSVTHRCSCVVIAPGCSFRPLAIREEGILDRLAALIGMDDIDFASAEFSKAFHVSAADRGWACEVITEDTMDFLLRSPRFSIEMCQSGILVWRGKQFTPADFDAAIELADGILRRIPAAVRSRIGLTWPT